MAISTEGKIGIGLGLFGLFGAGIGLAGPGLQMIYPDYTWIGWILIASGTMMFLCSIVGGAMLASHHFKMNGILLNFIWFLSGCAITIIILQTIHLKYFPDPRQSVEISFPSFEEIYKAAPDLGRPISQIITSKSAYVEGHDKSLMLWFQPLNHLIRFDYNNTARELDQVLQPNPEYRNDKTVQKILGLPNNCLPPYAGFAEAWKNNPSDWSPSGCRHWNCFFSSLRYQVFEHGLVVTGVPENVGTRLGDSLFYTRTARNGGIWTHLSMTTDNPPCESFSTGQLDSPPSIPAQPSPPEKN